MFSLRELCLARVCPDGFCPAGVLCYTQVPCMRTYLLHISQLCNVWQPPVVVKSQEGMKAFTETLQDTLGSLAQNIDDVAVSVTFPCSTLLLSSLHWLQCTIFRFVVLFIGHFYVCKRYLHSLLAPGSFIFRISSFVK